jgi:diacylglycerol kinase (ATP)
MAFSNFSNRFVMSIEGLNTAVEKNDFIHPNYHERIGFIKDIAAGAVFFAGITAIIIIGLIIYVPQFLTSYTQSRMAKTIKRTLRQEKQF